MFRTPKEREPQVRPYTKVTKSDKDIWTIAVKFDSQKVDKQSKYKSNKKYLRKDTQICYEKREKNHYTCNYGSPVFYTYDKPIEQNKIHSQKISVLPSINGMIINPIKLNDERDLLNVANWVGFTHTEQKDHRLMKLMVNERKMFDVTFHGIIPISNLFFTRPVRDPVTGLLHKESCRPKYVKSGTLGTISFFPFDFSIRDKLKSEDFRENFGKSKDELENEGWLLNPDFYDPSKTEYYQKWYGSPSGTGNGMPLEIRNNERLIPIFHEVCAKRDPFDTMDGSQKSLKNYLQKTLGLMLEGNTDNAIEELLTIDRSDIAGQRDFYNKVGKYIKDITDDMFRYKYRKFSDYAIPELVDFKVLGGPKDEFIVPFGKPMIVQVTMCSTK